jgi:multisubunit Na+/H+ antiporter MnhF subunit
MIDILRAAAVWSGGIAFAITWMGIVLLAISMAVCCLLLLRYPEVADRAIAFDLAMVHVVGLIALSAIVLEYPLLMDTLIVVAVLGFLGTVTIARYLERGISSARRHVPPAANGGRTRTEVRR